MNTSTLTHSSGAKASCGCGGGTGTTASCGCGGKGCAACSAVGFVRPNFFAGQLLTEEDLGALSNYVVAKNRLHNRHFIGEGVACGLEVLCHPCGGGKLVVRPGHAIDCCGNDLVLECPVELDVNVLVRDLRRNQRGGYDCGDPCANPPPEPKQKSLMSAVLDPYGRGKDEEEAPAEEPARRYCLYIRYDEQAFDPVAPYATDEPCGGAPCEYARVREGVRFELRCRPTPEPPRGFLQAVLACAGDTTAAEGLVKRFSALSRNTDAQAIADLKEALLDHIDHSPPLTNCRLRAEVAAIAVPTTREGSLPAARRLFYAAVEVMRECICRAMLPPCPPCEDSAVLLACLDIEECEVVDICNLERTFALTAPNFRYWYPVDSFGAELERLCCEELFPQAKEAAEKSESRAMASTAAPADAGAGAADTPPPAPAFDIRPPPAQGTEPASDAGIARLLELQRVLAKMGIGTYDALRFRSIAVDMDEALRSKLAEDIVPLRTLRRVLPSQAELREVFSRELLGAAQQADVSKEIAGLHMIIGKLEQRLARVEEPPKKGKGR